MFTFGVSYFLCLSFFVFVSVFVGVGVFMYARRACVYVRSLRFMCVHCICYSLYMLLIVRLFREMGKRDLGGMGV